MSTPRRLRPVLAAACGVMAASVLLAGTRFAAADADQTRGMPSKVRKYDERHPLSGFEAPRPTLIRWGQALKRWLAAEPRSGDAHLALGVWLECFNSPSSDSSGYLELRDTFPSVQRMCLGAAHGIGRPQCASDAHRAYVNAREVAPHLTEATLRAAGLDVAGSLPGADTNGGRNTLTDLAANADDVTVRYLAAMLLGEASLKRGEAGWTEASKWFTHARATSPRWISARLGVAAVAAHQKRTVSALEAPTAPDDPWYGYSCRILTDGVAAALEKWTEVR